MEKNQIGEEVTVTPVIRDLERLFNRAVGLIWSLIKWIFNAIGVFIKFIFHHILLFAVVVIIGGLLGYFSTEFFPREYGSSMVLKMNVDSKAQLKSDIDYLNALIERQQTKRLADLLKISEEDAGHLSKCELRPSATYVEKTEAVNQLYQATDTALFDLINYESLLADNNGELSAKFKITITATDQGVFDKLEKPLLNYLESSPEMNRLLEISIKSLRFQRAIYEKELERIDTLAKVMNMAMVEQARTSLNSGSTTNIMFGNDQMENRITPLDLQDRYLAYSQKITKIDLEIEERESCYFVNAHLSPFGSKIGYGRLSRALLSGVFLFLLTALILLLIKWRKMTV